MGKWDYRVIHVERANVVRDDKTKIFKGLEEAKTLGSEDWEAFAVTVDNTGWWVFLKRPSR